MNLNSIMIGSDNPEKLAEYYTDVFGKPTYEDDNFKTWQIGSGWLSVGPHSEVKGRNPHPGRILWNIESGDVRADFDTLKAAGARVVQEPYQPGGGTEMWVATFGDPDDNYFQLMSSM